MTAPTLTPQDRPPVARADAPGGPPAAPRAGVGAKLGVHSAVYALCGLLNKAIGFLLLPIYTHLLTAEQYGAVASVVVVATFLAVLFAMALGAAVMRYYHEYRDRPDELRAFLGTVLTAVLAVSVLGSAVLFAGGERLFGPLLGGVGFWPLMAMALGVAAFQPFTDTCLLVLQTAERPALYGVIAVSNLLARALLAIALVAGLGLGAEGVLGAHAATAVASFAVCAWCLRGSVRVTVRRDLLAVALRYSLPLLPHTLASTARQIVDRLFLLHLMSVAAAGLYTIGLQLGTLTQIVCVSCSKTLNPVFMRALQERDEARLANIRNLGLTLVLGYCWLSAGVSLFAPEVLALMTGPEFQASYPVVPFLAFAFAATGVYSLLINELLFHGRAARWVGAGTVASLGLAAGLNAALIPRFGMIGAAVAALGTQVVFVAGVAVAVRRYGRVRWQYGRFAVMFGLAFAAALWPLLGPAAVSWGGAGLKLALLAGLFVGLSVVAYGSPTFLLRELAALRGRLRVDR